MAYESLQDFYPPTVLSSPGDGIVRSTTNIRRAQFSLKIDSYSVLCEKLEKYESNVFEADGYKWNLCFYPKGNSKSGGDGYISLYLKIAETSRFQCGWEILAEFKFSVFDQLRDNYLTIQEAGTVRRFQEIKTEWGMAKLLLLGIFKDVSNGYLVDDCCVFGVQISVVRQIGRMECFKLIKEPVNNIYTWEIENFSTLNQNSYYSEAFTVEGTTWKLLVYPKGFSKSKGKALSIFLCLQSSQRIYIDYKLRVKNQLELDNKNKSRELTATRWINTPSEWGWIHFISLEDLKDKSKGYLVDDRLIVEAEIMFISVTKTLS